MTPRARGAFLAAVMATLATGAGVAHAASNDPTPYTVTADGITLPAGTTFPAHGHVNWRTTSSSGGIHFDPNNNQPGGAYIGKSFLPITLAPGECITWVQISLYDEHYGEGGQDPICKPTTTPTEEPTWTPEPTDPPTTAAPSSEPSTTPSEPSYEPSESPTTQPEPSEQPSSPTAEPSQPSPTPGTPTTEPEQPSTTPDPTGTPTAPAPIHCDPGYAPGWLDEHGNPTGCVANGPTDPEPEENPWTPGSPGSQPTTPEPSSVPAPPSETTPQQQRPSVTPSATDASSASRSTQQSTGLSDSTPSQLSTALAATGSDTAGWVLAAGLTLTLGAYLTTTNHRRKS